MSATVFKLDVVMIHDWKGHRKTCTAMCSGTVVLIDWGGFAKYECSLHTGRLKGSARTRMWRMRRNDLAFFRKCAGWRRDKVTRSDPGEKESKAPCS